MQTDPWLVLPTAKRTRDEWERHDTTFPLSTWCHGVRTVTSNDVYSSLCYWSLCGCVVMSRAHSQRVGHPILALGECEGGNTQNEPDWEKEPCGRVILVSFGSSQISQLNSAQQKIYVVLSLYKTDLHVTLCPCRPMYPCGLLIPV